MNDLVRLVQSHSAIALLVGYWGLSAFIGGMDEPTPADTRGYRWMYRSLHLFAANLKNVRK